MSKLQATELKGLSESEVVKKVGPLFTADQKKSGILASVSAAQFILESGYGKTELAQGANNCFGMKKTLSGNTWAGSMWDGRSVYTKKTQEDDGNGNLYNITADFRKYPCVEDSISDHSAYLLGAMNGSKPRYSGLKGEKDYKKAIQIIKDGGYATDTKYVTKICGIIERWNLTQFEVKETGEKVMAKPAVKYPDRPIIDITKENLSEVPARRGSNKIQFIVVHYLGVPNADNPYLYGGGYGGHYNIKRDGSVYKAADPKTAVVWHCGGGLQGSGGYTFHGICTNYNSIGIECGVCYTENVKEASGDSDKWYFTTETQESLVWLVAKLMKEYGIGIDHVIRHYDVSGKICPNPYVKNNRLRTSWTWDEFITKVREQVNGTASGTAGKRQETTAAKTIVLDDKYAKYINSASTHYISNSGSDENGGARGGKAGDQTGKEWCMRSWYNRPWSCILRYPDQKVALKIATLGIDAALNDKIGYDQNQRDSYWQQLKAVGYDPSKITTACEEDCSAGVCANVRAAGYLFGIAALQNHGGTYTGDMRSALSKAGFHVLTGSKYLSSPDCLLPGDILLNDEHHTATNVTIGSKVKKEWNPGTVATPATPTEPTKYFRVRKSWEDKASQIGAFTVLNNAILAVDANPGYAAFDDDGRQVYPTVQKSTFTKYPLTDSQLKKIARLCQQEQGTVAGAKAEASLMANQLETNASRRKKYGADADGLYNWVRNGGWFSRADHWMDNGSVSASVLEGVRDVLVNGNRTLPLYVDEHDCLSDIKSISTGSVKDRSAYVQGKTVIKNNYGSTYTFWCFPDSTSDPFGYTATAYKAVKG